MIQPPVTEFIATLKDAGYALRVEDGRLKVIHPSRPLTNEEREFIREHKPNIIQAVQNSPVQDDDWHSAIPKDAMRRIIEREQATWTPERRQAQENEIRRVEAYRQQRGPVTPGPSPAGSIPRAEVFARIGEAMERLGKIWPLFLPPDPIWQDKVNAAAEGPRETFLATVEQWETTETRRVEAYMYAIRRTVAGWPDEYRRRFSIMVEGFMRAERGHGITVRPSNLNQAQARAFIDLRPFVPATEQDTPADSPAPDDGLPFHDMSPATREIVLKVWRTWDAARRARFVQDVEDVMRKTGYSEGNACAFLLQAVCPAGNPGTPVALSPEEKEELHKRMWPTPPSTPQQEPKSAVPGPDIAKLVSRWPKALRMKYAGLVGKYSNSMPLNEAMKKAYAELRDTAEENEP